jgi:hypothetical protein
MSGKRGPEGNAQDNAINFKCNQIACVNAVNNF